MDVSSKVPVATLRYRFRYLGQRWRFLKRPLEKETSPPFPKLQISNHEPSVEEIVHSEINLPSEDWHQTQDQNMDETEEDPRSVNEGTILAMDEGASIEHQVSADVEDRPPTLPASAMASEEEALQIDLTCLRVFYWLPRQRDRLLRSHRKPPTGNTSISPHRPPIPVPSAALFRQQLSRKHKISLRFT